MQLRDGTLNRRASGHLASRTDVRCRKRATVHVIVNVFADGSVVGSNGRTKMVVSGARRRRRTKRWECIGTRRSLMIIMAVRVLFVWRRKPELKESTASSAGAAVLIVGILCERICGHYRGGRVRDVRYVEGTRLLYR